MATSLAELELFQQFAADCLQRGADHLELEDLVILFHDQQRQGAISQPRGTVPPQAPFPREESSHLDEIREGFGFLSF